MRELIAAVPRVAGSHFVPSGHKSWQMRFRTSSGRPDTPAKAATLSRVFPPSWQVSTTEAAIETASEEISTPVSICKECK